MFFRYLYSFSSYIEEYRFHQALDLRKGKSLQQKGNWYVVNIQKNPSRGKFRTQAVTTSVDQIWRKPLKHKEHHIIQLKSRLNFLGCVLVRLRGNKEIDCIIIKPAEERENRPQRELLFCSISSQVAIPKTSFKIRSVTLPMPPICT